MKEYGKNDKIVSCKQLGERMRTGKLFVISGPSGTGKGTICNGVLADMEGMELSISMTTRSPRPGEKEGKDYFFVTEEKFQEIKAKKGFLESAGVYEHSYGTPKKMVMEKLDSGKDVILEIDTQGALMVKESHPEGILIFILPPSLKVLKERITKRGTDSEEVISKRMKEAVKEISVADRYDYIVVNDELSVAVDTVKSIIKAERNKVDNNTIMKYIKKYEEEEK